MTDNQTHPREKSRKLLEAIVAYLSFCGIGLISRFIPVAFLLFLLFGIAFPLLWAKISKDWEAIGFTKRNLSKALWWGLGIGIVWGVYTYAVFRGDEPLPPLWGLQVVIALPIWLLVLSPFQEFFFRGWLQARFQVTLGKWWGLVVTSLAFTFWHFFPQLEGTMTATGQVSRYAALQNTGHCHFDKPLVSLILGPLVLRPKDEGLKDPGLWPRDNAVKLFAS